MRSLHELKVEMKECISPIKDWQSTLGNHWRLEVNPRIDPLWFCLPAQVTPLPQTTAFRAERQCSPLH